MKKIRSVLSAFALGISIACLYSMTAMAQNAPTPINVLDAFAQAQIVISFEASDTNVPDDLIVRLSNATQQPLQIFVPKGKTTFELNSPSFKSIVIDVSDDRVMAIDPGGNQVLSVHQTEKQRVVGGKLTVTKTKDGKSLSFEKLIIKAMP